MTKNLPGRGDFASLFWPVGRSFVLKVVPRVWLLNENFSGPGEGDGNWSK